MRARSVALALLLVAASARLGAGQTAANVLVVVNDRTPTGEQIARRYAERRALPSANICHVSTTADETVTRADYLQTIEQPVWRCIATLAGQDRILYIVLTKGMPIRIEGTGERAGTVASVDSELTLLYHRRTGHIAPTAGFVRNPYFAGETPEAAWKRFARQDHELYLVTRLDGYTVEDALALIDRSAASLPRPQGSIVLDGRAGGSTDAGNLWLRQAAARLSASGFEKRVLLDETSRIVTKEPQVLGYYSWGTNDKAIRIRHFELQFVPGALAGMFVSSDGRTMKEPPAAWTPGEWDDRQSYFGGSPQSLVGDLIRDGITGAAGHVNEPYLDAAIRPDILFPAYARGMNLAEAFYLAMPYLSWQTIVLGDPLCAPFRDAPVDTSAVDATVDKATELPSLFSSRRLEAIDKRLALAARQGFVLYESRLARGDGAGARAALEQTVAAAPTFTAARLFLASAYTQEKRLDNAIEQYRAVLAYEPNQAGALNNLAYRLAVDKNGATEALPLAERAVKLTNNAPQALDTLGWVLHLLGRDAEALLRTSTARMASPNDAGIRWHFAVILDALKDPRAREELDAYLKLDPSAAERPDVKRLRERLTLGNK
jgi:uncharacterized protein (TIGR03790 family)